jgi:starch phosphorylase
LNEGHAAFAVLARAVSFAKRYGVTLPVAFTATRAGNVFTTHTPVEAAFDRFDPKLIAQYAQPFLEESGFPLDDLLRMGRCTNNENPKELFNMACLAMRGCGHVNAVSRLHGDVSKGLFSGLFPRWPYQEIPVQPITNGVHVPTWASRCAARLWGEEAGRHLWLDGLQHISDRIKALPDDKLWAFRTRQRQALLDYVETRYNSSSNGDSVLGSIEGHLFDPNVLTLGFARRFASYKRANLMLVDPQRLKNMLLDKHRPVQLVVAGKAHPNDELGKALIQQVTLFLRQPELRGRTVFLEDYDMVVGQHMVAGVDVWLNTPLRPNEACGTSGMKVLANGGLNVSILDGWWDEALDGYNSSPQPGWVVGSRANGAAEDLEAVDAASLFDVLEQQVIPEFYDRDEDGIPHRWVHRVKSSMAMLTPQFSATRMLHEYIDRAYLPAASAYAARCANYAALAKEIREWTELLRSEWHHIRLGRLWYTDADGQPMAHVECWLDDIPGTAVRIQLYADAGEGLPVSIVTLQQDRELPGSVNGFVYCGLIPGDRRPSDYSVRVIPYHAGAMVPIENQCIYWND